MNKTININLASTYFHMDESAYAILKAYLNKLELAFKNTVGKDEILKDKRIQVSIFMSPFNVHVNRYPLGGKVAEAIHHEGKFLVAWHPKSSTLNERTTVTIDNDRWGKVLFRQIAGAVARRIVMYAKPGDLALQGSEYGFIKFGSRVDLFLPLDSEILVKEGEVVKGGITELAKRP